MNRRRIVTYDGGFGYVKAGDGETTVLHPAFITPGVPIPGAGKVTAVTIGKQSYLVGETARKQSGVVLESSLKATEHTSPERRLLAIASLALLAGGPGAHSFHVAAGLPLIHMEQEEALKAMLNGIKEVVVAVTNDRDKYTCTITVQDSWVYPQGLGVIFDYCLNHNGIPHHTITFPDGVTVKGQRSISGEKLLELDLLALDIGFNTALFYALSDMEPMTNFCLGSNRGMAWVYQRIGQAVLQGVDPWGVQDRIRKKELAPEQYTWAYAQVADQLSKQYVNMRHSFDLILVGGGGGAALFEHLLPEVRNKVLVMDPQDANARGYLKAGRQRWQQLGG